VETNDVARADLPYGNGCHVAGRRVIQRCISYSAIPRLATANVTERREPASQIAAVPRFSARVAGWHGLRIGKRVFAVQHGAADTQSIRIPLPEPAREAVARRPDCMPDLFLLIRKRSPS
jgi:hypothetical protein